MTSRLLRVLGPSHNRPSGETRKEKFLHRVCLKDLRIASKSSLCRRSTLRKRRHSKKRSRSDAFQVPQQPTTRTSLTPSGPPIRPPSVSSHDIVRGVTPYDLSFVLPPEQEGDFLVFQPSNTRGFVDVLEETPFPSETEDEPQQPLIPGLPDELALECLLRVSTPDHKRASGVCRRWNSMIKSEEFHRIRREEGFLDAWMYTLVRDKRDKLTWHALDLSTEIWHEVPPMPGDLVTAYGITCLSCEGRLYVIGGAGWFRPASRQVWCYLPKEREWCRVADLNSSRCHTAGGVMDGKIFVVGGCGKNDARGPSSAEVYHPKENKWSYISSLPLDCEVEDAVVRDGQLVVRKVQAPSQRRQPTVAARYNPKNDKWSIEEGQAPDHCQGPSVQVDGVLYKLDQSSGKLLQHSAKANKWIPLGHLPWDPVPQPCRLLGYQGHLYVVGRGGKTFVVDLSLLRPAKAGQLGPLCLRQVEGVCKSEHVVVSTVILEI